MPATWRRLTDLIDASAERLVVELIPALEQISCIVVSPVVHCQIVSSAESKPAVGLVGLETGELLLVLWLLWSVLGQRRVEVEEPAHSRYGMWISRGKVQEARAVIARAQSATMTYGLNLRNNPDFPGSTARWRLVHPVHHRTRHATARSLSS